MAQFGFPMFQDLGHANLRELRKLGGCFLERRDLGHFAQRDPQRLVALPLAQFTEILCSDRRVPGPASEVGQHPPTTTRAGANIRVSQPDKDLRILREACGAYAGNGEEMEERIFPEWELLDHFLQVGLFGRPLLGQAPKSPLDLTGEKSRGRLLRNPRGRFTHSNS